MSDITVLTEKIDLCPNCGSKNLKLWATGYDRLHLVSRQEFVYSICKDCQLVFISTRPIESEIHKFYPQNYGPYNGVNYVEENVGSVKKQDSLLKRILYRSSLPFNKIIKSIFPDRFHELFNNYYKLKLKGETVLDFGCGSDKFLNKAKSEGWNTIGMDFTEQPIEQIKKSGHKAILFNSPQAWHLIEDNSIDLVRMNHVLEHLYEPKEILQKIFQKMKKGGILHIAVPNPGGWSAALFKNKWRGFESPRHTMLYNPETLKEMLLKLKFSNVEILQETITKDFSRSYGFYLREKSKIAHSEIEKLADDHKLAGIFYIPSRIASLLKKADRIHAFATK
jgi:2-polyprenyl-3-methyl-5-hydroxy-6-metoxy-1,4-benzoquinol methylase